MRSPQPLYHATSANFIDGMPSGWTARTLHLMCVDGSVATFTPLVEYMVAHHTRSSTWQDTVARAIGLLWDFSRTRGVAIELDANAQKRDVQQALYRTFAQALVTGTVQDGYDPSGLYWPRTSLKRARVLIRSIEDFAQWRLGEESPEYHRPSLLPHTPQDPLTFSDYLVWGRVRNLSMLKHLKRDAEKLRVGGIVDFGAPTSGAGAEEVKSFPSTHMERLFWEGYARPGMECETNPFLRFNVRDQMIDLLDGYGGLRHCEGLHLWVQDVVEEPGRPGHALVVINHPSESIVSFPDPLSKREQKATREEVLNRKYGLRPRHLVKRGRYHAGWKGMDLNKQNQAFVYWLDDTAGALFWILYLGYLRFVRRPVMEKRKAIGGYDHPFLFVSEQEARRADSNGIIGDPYSPQAHERNQRAAVLRIGLIYGKAYGTTTQGMRHSYGQTLMRLGVPAQVIQKGLHHRHFLSQVPYTIPPRDEVNAQLNAAHARRNGLPATVPPMGHESAQALQKLHRFITSGEFDA